MKIEKTNNREQKLRGIKEELWALEAQLGQAYCHIAEMKITAEKLSREVEKLEKE